MSQEKKRKRKKKKKKTNAYSNINLKKSDDFLIKYGNEIPIIPDHIMSNIEKDGKVLLISQHDDDRFIQLSRDMATAWQRIDGKRGWKKILKRQNKYNTRAKIKSIYLIIKQILEERSWEGVSDSDYGVALQLIPNPPEGDPDNEGSNVIYGDPRSPFHDSSYDSGGN